jgi:hypothetical protein
MESEFLVLGEALRQRLVAQGVPVGSVEDALAILVAFLVDNDVVVLLDQLETSTALRSEALSRRDTRLVAAFVRDKVLGDPSLSAVLDRLIRGIVLQDALLLRSTSQVDQKLSELTVFLDTGFLLGLVGAKGEAARLAARESTTLLTAVGARLAAFHGTIDEMKRILAVYERHLGTAEGRLRLHSTPLTHHFLSVDATPSDVRQMSAALSLTVRNTGIVLRDYPKRSPKFTYDEPELERRLAGSRGDKDDSRIKHDVDCVAAILQLRGGSDAVALERTNAVFATTSGVVVRSVSQWFRDQGGKGVSPVMHLTALTNIAWLKKPAAAGQLQLHELAALCEVALQPSKTVWDAFRRHLQALEKSDELTSDEAVAIVASELATSMLADLSDDVDPDASTIAEIVSRVKAQYHSEADQRIADHAAEVSVQLASKEQAIEEGLLALTSLQRGIERKTKKYARVGANVAYWFLVFIALTAFALGLPGVFDRVSTIGRISAWIVFAATGGIQTFLGIVGGSPLALRDKVQSWLEPRVRRVQLEHAEPDT